MNSEPQSLLFSIQDFLETGNIDSLLFSHLLVLLTLGVHSYSQRYSRDLTVPHSKLLFELSLHSHYLNSTNSQTKLHSSPPKNDY